VARLAERHPDNVDGRWYVDRRCIDCDASRQHAPGLIAALADGQSVVARQPGSPEEEQALWRAALACPTRSIGTTDRAPAPPGVFPWSPADGAWLLGHNDRRSFGAHSWLVAVPGGNVMVDGPHWDGELVAAMEELGGVADVLLTHRDDVADALRYAEHFGARTWIHTADRDAAPGATVLPTERDPVELRPGVVAFPVPGHTRGSVIYLLDGRFAATGDSLAWSWRRGDLTAFRDACWYSWDEQRRSLGRLAASEHRPAWILPGHGMWHGAPPEELHDRLVALVARM